jgi:hypothetical protein
MLEVFRETGDQRFLDCFARSVEWYARALRVDGGMHRFTSRAFGTDCFNHAASGSACALIMFCDAEAAGLGTESTRTAARRALDFLLAMQLTGPADPNLRGAILEKVRAPDGTDKHPYHIRDLGTIFFVQALAGILKRSG